MNIGKYGIVAIIIVLAFLMVMWDKIVASALLGVGLTLGTLAILFGAGIVFGKLFRIF